MVKSASKPQRGHYGQEALEKAVVEVKEGKSMKKVSKESGISSRVLPRHRNNKVRQSGPLILGSVQQTLPDVSEEKLATMYLTCSQRSLVSLEKIHVRKLVYLLAVKNNLNHPFDCAN